MIICVITDSNNVVKEYGIKENDIVPYPNGILVETDLDLQTIDINKNNYKVVDNVLVELTNEEKVDLESAKQIKINDIELWCKTAITSGFVSSAYQGIEKTYASTLEDQANITGNALSSTSKIAGVPDCQNDKFYYHAIGEDFVEFTAEECLQLARDWKSFKETQLFKSKELQNFVNSLSTVDKINEVTNFNFVIPTA